ncbi:glycosyltransferase [Enterovirga sp.]|uniref:glycosyltransferase family 2 protein n=1 Tax=Enterovirga sp. TaxID=2026350 RepID=UPI002639C739|nr:glycosyltransferase [Enterovirga sp.]MDB5589610.1 hypothetical protein [Enterovirga sp.]
MFGTGLGRLAAHPALAATKRRAKGLLLAASERALGPQQLRGEIDSGAAYSLTIPGLAGPYLLTRGPVSVGGWALDLRGGRPLPVRGRVGRVAMAAETIERADIQAAFAGMADLPVRCGLSLEGTARQGPSLLQVEAEREPGDWRTLFRGLVLCLDSDLGRFERGGLWRYREWRLREAEVAAADAEGQRGYAAMVGGRPSITAIVLGERNADATHASLAAQTFPACETLTVPGGAADLDAALRAAQGDYTLPLAAGDRLTPDALYTLAAACRAEPGLDLVYADEEGDGDGDDPVPFFKPGWSPDTLESVPYLGSPTLYRTAALRGLEAPAGLYDLALRFTEAPRTVKHLGRVLCRRPTTPTAPGETGPDMAALAGRLARTGRTGEIRPIAPGLRCYISDIRPAEPGPLVSVVIPTAGRELTVGGRRLDLVLDCVRGIRDRSTYRNVEIVVVYNPDIAPAKLEALAALGCRTVLYREPAFNVAAKLNLGAAAATGEMLLLLNDDVDIISPDWIERLLAQATKPHVGAVGAKLLYPDGTVQHAGVVALHGNPNHVRRGYPDGDRGYVFAAAAARNYGAVTGAVMMTRADLYSRVGGYSEEFPIHFNDVDYCYKLRRLGLHIVLEPAARLFHFESASRKPSIHPEELALFQERWPEDLIDDPFYPNGVFATAPPHAEIFLHAGTGVR